MPSAALSRARNPIVRRLNPSELQDRRNRGLCFNCDEKFVPGHRCKKLFLIEGVYTEEDEWGDEVVAERNGADDDEPVISLHAITGSPTPGTMRVRGMLGKHGITSLMDSGSTHNFLSISWAEKIGLKPNHAGLLQVTVANGEKLECRGVCKGLLLWLQGEPFVVDFFLLALEGSDAVLGTQWFQTLGPIWWDFGKLWMKFWWKGRELELRGMKAPKDRVVENQGACKELKREKKGWLCQILPLTCEHTGTINLGAKSKGPSSDNNELWSILQTFKGVFENPQRLPPNRQQNHRIVLQPGSGPVNVRPYRYPHYQKNEIEKIVTGLLQSGEVRPSTSPYSSPVLLVKKHDGSWRLCVDYRALNHVTVKDKFPIPVIDELLDELSGARIFSKLDLRSGYHQIRMADEDIEKTAFRTHQGHYEFLVMPFGLTNAPSTFQSLMNEIFKEFLRRYVLVFFDDILIYSKSWAEHIKHLGMVLQILQENQLFVKREKCQFGQEQVNYLGHIISSQGVSMDPEKIVAMVQWPRPRSVKALRGFLGLTGYYRKFIEGYGFIASPLTQLLKKDAFTWNESAERAFEQLKKAMTTGPVLALPDFTKTFIVECDASGSGIGAVLMQDARPIAFFSQALKGRNLARSTYEKEMMALISAIQKWRPYLLGNKFIIRTDQKSLRYLLDQTITTEAQQKWLVKLLGYDFVIEYKRGLENSAADGLSRREEGGQLSALSSPLPQWIEPIKEEVAREPELQQLVKRIQDEEALGPWSYKTGLIFYKDRIYLRSNSPLTTAIIHEFHSGTHEGFNKMWHRLKAVFYWQGASSQIKTYLRECDVCQRNKSELTKPAGLLQPLPIPTTIWADISMDFVDGLPLSQGKTVVFVVVDRFSKYAHFIPLKHPYSATGVAQVFFDNIFKLHGIPTSIVCDRDPAFTSKFWQELFRLQGTRFNLSSSYHPQTDGQTEVVNRTLEMYLHCFTGDKPKDWVKWLSWAEYTYNTSYHSSTGKTPFEVVYGRLPPTLLSYIPRTAKVEAVEHALLQRDQLLKEVRFKLQLAQNRMKQIYDRGHQERSFQPGDFVYVRLQPYRQHSLERRSNMKLAAKFYGPYRVLERIGEVAYRVELPAGSKVHPIFHVSLLKQKMGSDVPTSTVMPEYDDGDQQLQPQAILDYRGNINNREVLIHWQGFSPTDATWESFSMMKIRFPDFVLEDKDDFNGEGVTGIGSLVYYNIFLIFNKGDVLHVRQGL
jgi:hypothetical protein